MQLVEAGQIELDAPVKNYLPEFTLKDPAIAARITVRQLLNQVSGMADAGFSEMRSPQPGTLAERVTSLSDAQPVAAPGTEFHYFNPNYAVLARVAEVVSGQLFANYLQTHIFVPLDMAHTFSASTSSEAIGHADQLAQGHLLAFGVPIAAPEDPGFFAGSGGVISTAEDLAHFLIMQNNGGRYGNKQIVSAASLKLMHTPLAAIHSDYGMGWFAMQEEGQPVFEHNGILSTFYAETMLLPEGAYGVVVLYNMHAVSADLLAFPPIKRGLIDLLIGQPPAPVGGMLARLA